MMGHYCYENPTWVRLKIITVKEMLRLLWFTCEKKKHSIPSDHIDWLRNSMLQITLWLYDIALDTMAHLDDL